MEFIKEVARVVPNENQLRWFEMEQYAFIHFGVNTFTGKQWGDGTEPESIFHPKKLDCDQWVEAIKASGLKGMVLTAKHHDGFCLWPSAYTEHSVKNSPCPYDIVKEASDACRRGGIPFGFYLSPWDRNSKYYGTTSYNDYYCNQLTELLTNYGEIFYVWFDNACSEEGKQTYDFPRYFDLVRKYQPKAVIFNDFGPDIRWCGNEAGKGREEEWAVVPTDLCHNATSQTRPGPDFEKKLDLHNWDQDLGTRQQILRSSGLAFVPSEIDTSIRKDWFWLRRQNPKSLRKLMKIYLNSVGHNACLHLNVPPTKEGLLDKRDVKRLKAYGQLLKACFSNPVELKQRAEGDEILLELPCPVKDVTFVTLREDLTQGQRIESFEILAGSRVLYRGKTVGNKQICCLRSPFALLHPKLWGLGEEKCLRIRITSSRDVPILKPVLVYRKEK